ncbi:transporter substrate-binding domain-containing protein [Zunongwangia sp. F260]|uniref:Transporter substrate-binding domain-containing protein n=1 Tax=Autumnicola lenta TaxID=3075593 RepID=A0ABU3CGP4_9FLAO|nr:transporter substrate-binding domain-containing protein [Zunongwangia sp. F260]MDT0645509.1 transporter substrate-binding domain-containing protein [Zunongwangia sp. F260]
MQKALIVLALLMIMLSSAKTSAQTDSLQQGTDNSLVVGVFSQPPYMIADGNGNWDGISIRLWRAVADRMNVKYELKEISRDSAVTALLNQKADIVLFEDVTPAAEKQIDFSHIYHKAEMGVASPPGTGISSIVKAFFSKRFWYIAGMLSILLLIVGSIIYFIERNSNEDNFGGERSIAKGIGSGFWWAGVTMTTIGYGDKAPVTFWGRAVALIWMLVAMAVTAVLTASLVSAVMGNSGNKIDVPGDLRDMKMVAVKGSFAADYMKQERIPFQEVKEISVALKKLKNMDAEAVLNSVPVMRYTINNDSDLSLKVQAVNIDPHYYAFGIAQGDSLREPLNLAVLQVINSNFWQQELDRYVPEKKRS